MAARLLLRRYGVENVNFQWAGAYRLRIEVTDPSASGADANVFLYLRNLPNPYTNETIDVFHAVASPADLAEYPVGEPDSTTTYPFYRLSYVELDLRAVELADQLWVIVVREVDALLKALEKLEGLTPVAEAWVGAGAPEDSGSSSSSSSSSSQG
jgi:hypothetical protein